jgi:predicted nucleotidyltransferase component of viral defense system
MTQLFNSATDFRKSLESRLKNLALTKDLDLQRLRRKVAFDRLLARLFSEQKPRFFLKGGYAMELRLSTARATKDIDLTSLTRVDQQGNPISQLLLSDLRSLARKDLDDFFIYQIGEAQIDLDNAPYGGARFPVSSLIDGKVFVKFQLDVGADAIVDKVESLPGADWLGFCGIPAPDFAIISIEQQFAEKLHAYTLPRPDRLNTRVKDLIDMVLLARIRPLDLHAFKSALDQVFRVRKTHNLPQELEPPPTQWHGPYDELAKECSLSLSLGDAFAEVVKIRHSVLE